MRSVVYRREGRFELDPEYPTPQVEAEDDVLVKVRFCGVCGTDLHLSQHLGRVAQGDVLGHEISGVVAKVGPAVSRVRPGDRVTALCWGGYAEYVKTAEGNVLPLPEGVTFEQGALSEPFGVGLQAVRESPLRPGDRAAVVGAGPIGLFTMLAARLAGARDVYVAEVAPARSEAARRLGAAGLLNPRETDPEQAIPALLGEGVDVVYDCAGAPGTLKLSLDMVRKGGAVMVVGLSGLPEEFNTRWLFRTHARVMAVPGAREAWALTVQLLARGMVDPSVIISHTVPLEELAQHLEALQRPSDQVQVMADPWGDRF